MTATKTDNGQVTLTQEQLDQLLDEARKAAIQAVATMTTPAPAADPEPVKVVNLTNAKKVASDLEESKGRSPKDPMASITYNQRRAVIAGAVKGSVKWDDLAGWTSGQASAAIQALRAGYGVKVGPFELMPRA